MKRISEIISIIASCLVIPFSINYFMYYAYMSQYTKGVFSKVTFLGQYGHGVYRYRVLGRKLVLLANEIVEKYFPQDKRYGVWFVRSSMDEQGTPDFYMAYFALNTIFLVLTLLVLYFILRQFTINPHGPIFVVTAMFAISQFVIVPYDALVYFFLLLAIFALIRSFESKFILYPIIVVLCIVLGGMTRETIVLVLAFYAAIIAVNYKIGKPIKGDIFKLSIYTLAYIMTYVGLRLYYGFENSVSSAKGLELVKYNLQVPGSIIAVLLLTAIIFLLLATNEGKLKRLALNIFWLFTTPYLFTVFYTGIWMEIRLFVPLVLVSIIINYMLDNRHP